MSQTLRVLPLGGLGEIGKNMTVVEYDDRIIVVDVGLRFPTPEMVGIDLVLPDFSYLRERARDIEAIVVTHGHEDHLGALPWVLRELRKESSSSLPPVYAGALTVAMARSKLEEHKLRDVELNDIDPGETLELGPFSLELVHMTHSIPDSSAVALGTELGTVLITGDYKFDQTPVDGAPADVSRLAELGREGVLLLCGDSTNVDRAGFSPSESVVGPHLEEVFARCEGRIVVTSFASNIHRVQQVVDAAYALDRKVALVGRSMRKNVGIGRTLGHIEIPDGMLVGPREIADFPDERVVIISTGSQGEPLSALRRMAYRDHPQVELKAGDTVVFSATPVPGNERAVNETVDRLYHIGCDVITPREAPVHASGHGYAEEVKLMLNLVKPRYVMPFHGDFKRLRLHAQLAEAVGVDTRDIFRGDNGLPLDIDERGARFGSREQAGMIFVDGVEIGEMADAALRDRRMLSADGIFIVVVTIAEQDGTSVADPEVIFRGVPFLDQADELVEEIRLTVEDSLRRAASEEIRETDLLQQALHDDLAKLVYDRLKRRRMVLPVVVEVWSRPPLPSLLGRIRHRLTARPRAPCGPPTVYRLWHRAGPLCAQAHHEACRAGSALRLLPEARASTAPSVGLGDCAHDREAQPERAAAVTRAAHEALEQRRYQLRGDPRSVVFDHQLRLAVRGGLGRDVDLGTRRRVTQGVFEQVDRDPVQLVARAQHDRGVDVERDVVLSAHRPELAGRLHHDLRQVARFVRHHPRRVGARQQQQVGDQASHPLRRAQRRARGVALVVVQRFREQLEVRQHACQRRAQLV